MQTLSHVGALGCLLILSACGGSDAPQSQFSERLVGEVVELRHVLSLVDFVLRDDRIYTLDRKDMRVTVYSRDGRRLRYFGRLGAGPGEFRRPVSMDVNGNHVAVSERSGRTSIFDTTGVFLHSFVTLGIMHLNSQMRFLNDSLIFIGGLREEAGDGLYDGQMGHIYTLEGERKHDFMPLTEKARMYETTVAVGASCDDDGQILWCTQSMDYKIRRYDFSGNDLGAFTVEPEYYRPLQEAQPKDFGSKAALKWLHSWDFTSGVYSISDSLLVCEVIVGGPGGRKIDVIHKGSGEVLATHNIEGGLVYVSSEEQLLVFQRPSPLEPVTILEFVPVSRLLS